MATGRILAYQKLVHLNARVILDTAALSDVCTVPLFLEVFSKAPDVSVGLALQADR